LSERRRRLRAPAAPGGRVARLLACVVAVSFVVALGADRAKLEKLRESIRRHQEDLRKAEAEVSTSVEDIQGLDQHLEGIDKTLRELSGEIVETSGRMAATEADLAEAQGELAAYQRQLAGHLRMVYKWGRYPMVKFLVSAVEMEELVRRVRFTMALAREDRRLARAVARKRDEIKSQRDALARELAYVKSLEELNLKELTLARRRREQKKGILAAARSRRDVLQKRLRALKKEKAALEALVRSRSGGGRPAPRPGRHKGPDLLARHGKVIAPTRGAVIRNFGLIEDDRYGTVTKNEGIDFSAPLGSEVKTVMKGKVVFADWFRGYGKLVIVDHGGGYTSLYAHLGQFGARVGDRVAEGEPIATVGDTGYVARPTLHFEIRRDGVAVNPTKWLRK